MEQNAGFVSMAIVCVAFTVVIIILSIALAVTCWHKVMVVTCICVHTAYAYMQALHDIVSFFDTEKGNHCSDDKRGH